MTITTFERTHNISIWNAILELVEKNFYAEKNVYCWSGGYTFEADYAASKKEAPNLRGIWCDPSTEVLDGQCIPKHTVSSMFYRLHSPVEGVNGFIVKIDHFGDERFIISIEVTKF